MKKVLFGILGAIMGILAGYIAVIVISAVFGFVGGIINYDSTMALFTTDAMINAIVIIRAIAVIGGGILGSIFLIGKVQ